MDSGQDTVLEKIRTIIGETLRIPPEEVDADIPLGEGLGAESLDFIDIIFRIQSSFLVRLYEGGVLERLAEVFGSRALVEEDRLTELGAEVLRRRMVELDPEQIRAGMPVSKVESLYTPRTLVRSVQELLDARPEACPGCGSTRLKPIRPSLLQCQECSEKVPSPDQGEVLGRWGREIGQQLVAEG